MECPQQEAFESSASPIKDYLICCAHHYERRAGRE